MVGDQLWACRFVGGVQVRSGASCQLVDGGVDAGMVNAALFDVIPLVPPAKPLLVFATPSGPS